MSKEINWDSIAKVNFDDQRRKANGGTTGKELFAKAFKDLQKSEAALARKAEVEPILKKALISQMVSRTPIEVLSTIRNATETIGGLSKSEEDDGFYNTSPSANAQLAANKKFEETFEYIPAGTKLVFKALDKQLGQMIFKGSNGQEYAIYDKSVIMFQGQAIENPGLYGLLFQTSIVNVLEGEAD